MNKYFDKWKENCLAKKEHYLNWGWQSLNDALRGTKPGTSILIGGQANFGKSQVTTGIVIQLLEFNEDVIVLDFSVDDSKENRVTQYVASLARIPMNDVMFANNIEDPELKEKFTRACDKFESVIDNKLFIYESIDENGNLQATFEFIEKKVSECRGKFPNSKLVIIMDSLNDIEMKNKVEDAYLKSENIAKAINNLLIRYSAVLIATTHIRKNNGRRPNMDDLKGNNYLTYTAKVVIAIHNDLKIRKDSSKIYWERVTTDKFTGQKVTNRLPVVELHFLKSKVSSFNGLIPFLHIPSEGRIAEPPGDMPNTLKKLINGEMGIAR